MAGTPHRSRRRRPVSGIGAAAALTAAAVAAAPALADPRQEEVERHLGELAEAADTLVQKRNEAEEDLTAARLRLRAMEVQVRKEEERYSGLRGRISGIANAAYRSGDIPAASSLLFLVPAEEAMVHAADLDRLSRGRRAELAEFTGSAERLAELRTAAGEAVDRAAVRKEELAEKTEEVEDALAEQDDVLNELAGHDALEGIGSGTAAPGTGYQGSASGNARIALDFAYAQIGSPYEWGGIGNPGYDCSGLVMRAWGAAGVSLPRSAWGQAEVGRRVDRESLRPGDLVFFHRGLGHVGMYAGDGRMVHAPSSGGRVELVPMAGYWDARFRFGVRP